MWETEIGNTESQEGEKLCPGCQKSRPLMAFPRQKGKTGEWKKLCYECERLKQYERHLRLEMWREKEQLEQQGREERRQQEWERMVALRQVHEEQWQERERWYLQQPNRCCRTCHQFLPASAFAGISSATGFKLYTRCRTCHETWREQRQLACCLCQEKRPRCDFLSHYNGYALHDNGISLALCCKGCEVALYTLPDHQRSMYIHECCQRMLPSGQVIYAEVDPETSAIRYIGRTGEPRRRHAQHLGDISPAERLLGPEKKVWYTRSNWMYALSEKGLSPYMDILQAVEVPPLAVEWEQRYIWHGIQQGWELLNVECMDEELVDRVRASPLDFLQVPFEILVQQHFFSSHGLVAFLHEWYHSKRLAG